MRIEAWCECVARGVRRRSATYTTRNALAPCFDPHGAHSIQSMQGEGTMSNVISFLESVGQDAALRHATKEELELALNKAQIDPALQTAILEKDQRQIEALLGAASNVCCGVFPGKE